jgi:hypothetical protein
MERKFHYILSLFQQVYRIRDFSFDISYGIDHHSRIQIRKGNIEPLENCKPFFPDPKSVLWKNWHGTKIPFFFNVNDCDIFEKTENYYIINVDIVASSFYLISGWQEYFNEDKDWLGRFPWEKSVQCVFQVTEIPLVNYYFDILRTVTEMAYDMSIKQAGWKDKSFSVCLTHDIDTCETGWLEGGFHALKKRKLLTAFNILAKKIFSKDVWFNFNEILSLEKQYSATSTFFFLMTNCKKEGIKNADYIIAKKKFIQVFSDILEANGEIGLHGSIGTSKDINLLVKELSISKQNIKGNRFHFLYYDVRQIGQVLDRSPLQYDSSFGFPEHFGFRNSFCFPFQPYNIKEDKPFRFYEIPLVLMDGTLQKYLKKRPDEALQSVESLFTEVERFGGCMTILWHNTHFSPYKYNGWKSVYEQILKRNYENNGWLTSCQTLLRYYITAHDYF